MTDDQLLAAAKDAFALCEEAESENRLAALDDLKAVGDAARAPVRS